MSLFDDEIAEMYLEGEEIPVDRLKAAIRKRLPLPVHCRGTVFHKHHVNAVQCIRKLYVHLQDILADLASATAYHEG